MDFYVFSLGSWFARSPAIEVFLDLLLGSVASVSVPVGLEDDLPWGFLPWWRAVVRYIAVRFQRPLAYALSLGAW